MKKCLVLGATGFIGKNLCSELIKTCSVRAMVRRQNPYLDEIGVQQIVQADFSKLTDFVPYLDGVDTVYHLISTTLPKEGSEGVVDEEIVQNVIPTVHLLESMKRAGVKKIIFASSGGTIYGDHGDIPARETDPLNPKSAYGLQKQLIENCINFYRVTYGIQARIVRISNPYGCGQQLEKNQGVIPIFIRKLLADEPITVWGGENLRDYIFMDDLVSALISISAYDGDEYVFNIAGNQVFSIKDVIETIEEVVGKKFSQITYESPKASDVGNTCLDISRIEQELDWHPMVSLKEGIGRVFDMMLRMNN